MNSKSTMPKALEKFVSEMQHAADEVYKKISDDNTSGNIEITRAYVESQISNGYPINMYMLCEMLCENENIKSAVFDGEHLKVKTTDDIANEPYSCFDEGSYTDIEVMCAKHVLWINSDDAGVPLDLSNSSISNIDFIGKDLSQANFENAIFENCNFNDANLNHAMFKGAEFRNCSFRNTVAEEADLSSAKFDDCKIASASFMHSDFHDSNFFKCDLSNAIFQNAYVKNVSTPLCKGVENLYKSSYTTEAEYLYLHQNEQEVINIEEN